MAEVKKNYKIGLVIDTFLPQIGGAEIHVENLAKFLKKEGYHVRIFTNTPGKNMLDDIEIERNKGYGFKPFRFSRDIKNLGSFIKSCDLVHAHYSFYLAFLAVLLAKLLRKPYVVTLHGLGTLDSAVANLRRKIFRYFSLKLADAILATSDEMAEVALRFNKKERIFLVPNAVNIEFFKAENLPRGNKIRVLSMRRLHPKNGVQYLTEAVPYVIKKIRNIEFLIAGKEKLENYLRKRVKELRVGDYVKFIGEVPNEKTLDYYRLADIVVFPSSAESTSIACLEAMACQKAVVASTLKAYKEMLGENQRGILIKLFDRESSDYNAPLTLPVPRIKLLAEAIIKLAENPSLREKLGREAREYVVKNYDWRVIIKKIQEIYHKVIKLK